MRRTPGKARSSAASVEVTNPHTVEAGSVRRVVDAAALESTAEQRLGRRRAMGIALEIGVLDEHRPWRRRERLAQRREMHAHEAERGGVHDLEAREARTERRVRQREQLDR